MSADEKAKAAGKNIEGKAQEAFGNLTGDPEHQAEGQAKQAEAKARNVKEDVKDKAKDIVDRA
ncbi:CsbD family protein [Leptolyngbya sp. FACHB-261]|uniref:CsbD family protein n=1 Tax=Leptolyngbya sp. FACHB-261 TaxID=2692806 RepID=UPI0016859E4D|nr:CsbD family protein [Leptolyngbya sp. FACHB-261]MBD2103588.1 CsbD family protein [Leptolyngbya sp. FACHB-261]